MGKRLERRDEIAGGSPVERRGRFIGENDRRALHQRPGDSDALPLASAEDTEVAGRMRPKLQILQCSANPNPQFRSLDVQQPQCHGNVVEDVET